MKLSKNSSHNSGRKLLWSKRLVEAQENSVRLRDDPPPGPIAQSGRAAGSYPVGSEFKSLWALHDLSRSTLSENRRVRTWTNGPVAQHGRCRGLLILSTLVQIQPGSPFGDLAQLGERLSGRQKVAGSTPAVSTIQLLRGACWLALGLITHRYVGSIPTPATNDPVAKWKGIGLQVRSP